MKVIICGAGRVGHGIAQSLVREGHEVTLVDSDGDLIQSVTTELDIGGVTGHAAHPDVLRAAGAGDCEMIIAVTHFDEINMVICQVAHTLFSVTTKVARIRARAYLDKRWSDLFSRAGIPIDEPISPEIEVGNAIIQRFRTPGSIMSAEFAKGRVDIIGFDILASSPMIDTPLDQIADLFPDLTARVVGIGRHDKVYAPRSNDKLVPGDRAYVAVVDSQTARLNMLFGRDEHEARHIIIVGGGNIGLYVAERLERNRGTRVRLIERDPARADEVVAELKRTIVINGDGLDQVILEEAGVEHADFVVGLTDDDRTNLLIGNLSKRLGAARSLALVNQTALANLSRDMNVDVALDPRALTVSVILRKLRKGRILSVRTVEDGKAEILEGKISETSPLIGKPLGYDDLPDGVTAAAILRGETVLFPGRGVTAKLEDRLVVFAEPQMRTQVEKFFRVSQGVF